MQKVDIIAPRIAGPRLPEREAGTECNEDIGSGWRQNSHVRRFDHYKQIRAILQSRGLANIEERAIIIYHHQYSTSVLLAGYASRKVGPQDSQTSGLD